MFSDPTNIVGSRIRAVRTQLGLSQGPWQSGST